MNKFELLAPAGTYDAFIAATENGADAVYLGGKLFNARANASNFDNDELKKIVEYAHLRNVKIYVTMNTLLTNNELNEALDFAYDLYNMGIDAVIVQDLGLAKVLHERIPLLHLHASTQMTIYNLAGVKRLEALGFTRVVLARELSLDEIKYICDNTDRSFCSRSHVYMLFRSMSAEQVHRGKIRQQGCMRTALQTTIYTIKKWYSFKKWLSTKSKGPLHN